MPDEPSSLNLRNTHELFLLVPLKHGFVEGTDRRTSFANRLQTLLNMLFAPSQGTIEKSLMPRASFADELQNLYHFHYGVVDRLQGSQLILSATFDSSWEAYFRNLVDQVGPILDAVFCHCQGFAGRTCADGYEAFADFIREHQVQAGILYAATPDMTTDDLRMLRGPLRGEKVETPARTPKAVADTEEELWRKRYSSEAWQGQAEFDRLRLQSVVQFVYTLFEIYKLFPDKEMIDAKRSAREVFKRAVLMLFESIPPKDLEAAMEQLRAAAAAAPKDTDLRDLCVLVKEVADDLQALNAADTRITRSAGTFKKENVQENIVESCGSDEGLLALLRFPADGPGALLRRLSACLRDPQSKNLHLNVALTYAGLRRAGLDDGTLDFFPKEFRQGMERRAGALGDVGWPNHPDYWHEVDGENRRFSLASIDLVLIFHRKLDNASSLEKEAEACLSEWWHDSKVLVHREALARHSRDAFKYLLSAGETQPTLPGELDAKAPAKAPLFDNHIAAGDLFLGHENSEGEVARSASAQHNPHSHQLFLDGTFLVIRKLAQNAKAFERYKEESGRDNASILGFDEPPPGERSRHDHTQIQDYSKTQAGQNPLPESHVRRTNPRDGIVPRLMRRSFSYEGPYDAIAALLPASKRKHDKERQRERGHMFMAYNASIAQQFEVIQRWINGGNSTGMLSSKTDALASEHVPAGLKDDPANPHVPNVTLRWGMYLFVPSKAAIGYLAEMTPQAGVVESDVELGFRSNLEAAKRARLEKRGQKLLTELDAIQDGEIARLSWKQLFEEASREEDSRAVWAAIRARGGRKDTPYGLLVADHAGAKLVLGDDGSKFSVQGYRNRLLASAGDFYLGIDREPRCPYARGAVPAAAPRCYQALAAANETLRARLKSDKLAEDAATHVRDFLAPSGAPERDSFDLRDVARQVVGKISLEHIGLPQSLASDDFALRAFLDHFVYITRYMSFPYPENWLAERAIASGKTLRSAYGTDPKSWGGIGAQLQKSGYGKIKCKDNDNDYAPAKAHDDGDESVFRDAVIGANIGFVPPALSMLVGTMVKWIENGDIEHPRVLQGGDSLRAALVQDLSIDPTFTTIFRTAVEGNGLANPGSIVVVGVQSAYEDAKARGEAQPVHWLFGGDYKTGDFAGTHACPMAEQSLAIMAGALHQLATYIRARLQRESNSALVRLGPTRYGFSTIGRILPGQNLT